MRWRIGDGSWRGRAKYLTFTGRGGLGYSMRLTHPLGADPMLLFICTACGTQYPESADPPAQCNICEEERQYVPPRGQPSSN